MIKTEKHLAFILKVHIKELRSILTNIDKYYGETIIVKTDKFDNPKLKLNGEPKTRIINPSRNRLKVIQKRLQLNVLQQLEMPDYAYGAIKGKDNLTNAKRHLGKKYKFTTDLRDFYPSISNRIVNQMLLNEGFSPTVAHLITRLTTYKGYVPQGAPTSSTIANLVFKSTGDKLSDLAKRIDATFTSFVDDLTFSSPEDFKEVLPEILSIIAENHRISHSKTNYSRNPNITGVHVMNNHLMLPKSFMDKINNLEGKTPEQIEGLYRYKKRVNIMNYGNGSLKK